MLPDQTQTRPPGRSRGAGARSCVRREGGQKRGARFTFQLASAQRHTCCWAYNHLTPSQMYNPSYGVVQCGTMQTNNSHATQQQPCTCLRSAAPPHPPAGGQSLHQEAPGGCCTPHSCSKRRGEGGGGNAHGQGGDRMTARSIGQQEARVRSRRVQEWGASVQEWGPAVLSASPQLGSVTCTGSY